MSNDDLANVKGFVNYRLEQDAKRDKIANRLFKAKIKFFQTEGGLREANRAYINMEAFHLFMGCTIPYQFTETPTGFEFYIFNNRETASFRIKIALLLTSILYKFYL